MDVTAQRPRPVAGSTTRRAVRHGGTALALAFALATLLPAEDGFGESPVETAGEESESRLSDEPKPFLTEGDIPERPPLILEIGDDFLGEGELNNGFELPTGAVWQPRLWVFGTMRSAVQTIDTGRAERTSEFVNRGDFFANLQLTGTEKVVFGVRPFDKNEPDDFSGYRFEPDDDSGRQDEYKFNVRTLFAEGDFGSLFPNLDPNGTTLLDFGFSVGRQPLIVQDGILLSDTVDSVGLVRNNIRLPGVSNLRVAGVWGWNEVTRSATGVQETQEDNVQLFGLFTEWDLPDTTLNFDAAYTLDEKDGNDGLFLGFSAAQRIGHFNTTFRANGSLALGSENETALTRDGILLSAELSWTPWGTEDTLYANPFVAFGEFLQAGRELVDGGGPLAPIGILFASPNIGNFGSELVNRANDVGGIALGYQAFWNDNWTNLAVELAVRQDLGLDGDEVGFDQQGVGFQFQQKLTQQMLLQIEGFGVRQQGDKTAYGGRTEILYQF
ncbi:MAG: hypothetical protein QNJ06_13590 [Kiloniellales bacterium]|nr:hypothetical protein [Kiloniellales bacterium]MDJ0970921.1 hypothetical protein [Kiloniellales bacterium]MDJ0982715.1 hypothetical protein [Kiloniellales bacterium]